MIMIFLLEEQTSLMLLRIKIRLEAELARRHRHAKNLLKLKLVLLCRSVPLHKESYQPEPVFQLVYNMVIIVISFILGIEEVPLITTLNLIVLWVVMPTRFTMQVVT